MDLSAIKKVKLVVTVPSTHSDVVRKAIGDAGGGVVGNYSHCSFSSTGSGRFIPTSGAKPHIGNIGSPETVQEERVEVNVMIGNIERVIAAMKVAHPYEEVAYDIYPLLDL